MPPSSPKLYDNKKTTIWFSITAIVLFVSLVAMVLQDSAREWKEWQGKFMELSREKAEADLREAEHKIDSAALEKIKADREKAEEDLKSHRRQIGELTKESEALAVEQAKVNARNQELKQEQDSDRYYYEEFRHKKEEHEAEARRKRMETRQAELDGLRRKLDQLETAAAAKKEAVNALSGKVTELDKEMARMTEAAGRIETKVEKLTPDWRSAVLNAPMLDFIKPTLQIQQIVVEGLRDDYYFTKVPKVDRCVTCHLGIDQTAFTDAPVPFKAHPRLDLFLSPDSPHPMEKFGCTSCHGGSGHSVSFTTAAHTPRNEEQAEEWQKKHHWHEMEYWNAKMLPMNYIEASCAKCHQGTVDVPQAPKLNEGRRLAGTFSCFGCHKIKGFESYWETGPGLLHVQSKLQQDWIVRWLQNPKAFRPSTKMPRLFHLSNTSDPDSADKNNALIAGIAHYLIKNSEPVSLENVPGKGDPETGKKLVETLGCLGCHSAGDKQANDHGPELLNLGSKVKPEWLYSWLKNPKAYHAGTRMPDLRLSNEEAAHITSYLLQQKDEKFDSLRLPAVKPEVIDQTAMHFLTVTMREEQALEALKTMNEDDRLEYIGKKAIIHQGCFGCHAIKGFDGAAKIGTELSEHGSKDVEKLDFGFVPIERTRQAWFFQKLKDPRGFDHGKVKSYFEKLRMPQFDFTDEQAEALTTFLLSMEKGTVPLEMQKRLDLKEKNIEAGRFLARQFNCQGCHTLDGETGRVRSVITEPGDYPPAIDGEGKKVQPQWLYHFLEHPSVIRPWLTYRMPTFGFSEERLTALVQYFSDLAGETPDYKREAVTPESPAHQAAGPELFKSFQCIKCHKSDPEPGLASSFLAPDLVMSKSRLQPEWVADWLKDPQALQSGTMMPAFFPDGQSPMPNVLGGDAAQQIEAIRDYLWAFDKAEAANAMEKPEAK